MSEQLYDNVITGHSGGRREEELNVVTADDDDGVQLLFACSMS